MNTLEACEPGLVPLTPSRFVYWTGRVAVGLRYEPLPERDLGVNAEAIQALLTTEKPREWHPTPPVIVLKPSLWQRLKQWWLEGAQR